jgi:hypothetical protein
MTIRNGFLIGISVASAFFSLGTASAGVITVNDANFQTTPAGGYPFPYFGNAFSEAPIPGWTNLQTPGVSGQNIIVNSVEYNSIPNGGDVFGYTNGATISQTVGATVQVGDVYTLALYFGQRNDIVTDETADLLVNGVQYFVTGTAPPVGGWSLFTGTYTGLALDAGDAITIQLNNVAGHQGDFDDVSLNDSGVVGSNGGTSTPEPGYAGVTLACLGSLTLAARMRRAKQR